MRCVGMADLRKHNWSNANFNPYKRDDQLLFAEVVSRRQRPKAKGQVDPLAEPAEEIVSVDLSEVLNKSTGKRIKWLEKALSQVEAGKVTVTSIFDIVSHKRFCKGTSEQEARQMGVLLVLHMQLFTEKQQRFLQSEEFGPRTEEDEAGGEDGASPSRSSSRGSGRSGSSRGSRSGSPGEPRRGATLAAGDAAALLAAIDAQRGFGAPALASAWPASSAESAADANSKPVTLAGPAKAAGARGAKQAAASAVANALANFSNAAVAARAAADAPPLPPPAPPEKKTKAHGASGEGAGAAPSPPAASSEEASAAPRNASPSPAAVGAQGGRPGSGGAAPPREERRPGGRGRSPRSRSGLRRRRSSSSGGSRRRGRSRSAGRNAVSPKRNAPSRSRSPMRANRTRASRWASDAAEPPPAASGRWTASSGGGTSAQRGPPPGPMLVAAPQLLPTGVSAGMDHTKLQAAQIAAARRLQVVPVAASAVRPGDWFCPICAAHNYASKFQCFRCIKGTNPLLDGSQPQIAAAAAAGGGRAAFGRLAAGAGFGGPGGGGAPPGGTPGGRRV